MISVACIDEVRQVVVQCLEFLLLRPDFFQLFGCDLLHICAAPVLVLIEAQKLSALFDVKSELPCPSNECQLSDRCIIVSSISGR